MAGSERRGDHIVHIGEQAFRPAAFRVVQAGRQAPAASAVRDRCAAAVDRQEPMAFLAAQNGRIPSVKLRIFRRLFGLADVLTQGKRRRSRS